MSADTTTMGPKAVLDVGGTAASSTQATESPEAAPGDSARDAALSQLTFTSGVALASSTEDDVLTQVAATATLTHDATSTPTTVHENGAADGDNMLAACSIAPAAADLELTPDTDPRPELSERAFLAEFRKWKDGERDTSFCNADYWKAEASTGENRPTIVLPIFEIEELREKGIDLCPDPTFTRELSWFLLGGEPQALRRAWESGRFEEYQDPYGAIDHLTRDAYTKAQAEVTARYETPSLEAVQSSRGLMDIAPFIGWIPGPDRQFYLERMVERLKEEGTFTAADLASQNVIRSVDELVTLIEGGAELDRDQVHLTDEQVRNFANPELYSTEPALVHETAGGDVEAMGAREAAANLYRIENYRGAACGVYVRLSNELIEQAQERLRQEPDRISRAESRFSHAERSTMSRFSPRMKRNIARGIAAGTTALTWVVLESSNWGLGRLYDWATGG